MSSPVTREELLAFSQTYNKLVSAVPVTTAQAARLTFSQTYTALMSASSTAEDELLVFSKIYYNALVRASTSEVGPYDPSRAKDIIKFEFRFNPSCTYQHVASHYEIRVEVRNGLYHVTSNLEDGSNNHACKYFTMPEFNEQAANEMAANVFAMVPARTIGRIDILAEMGWIRDAIIEVYLELGGKPEELLYQTQHMILRGFGYTIRLPGMVGARQASINRVSEESNVYSFNFDKPVTIDNSDIMAPIFGGTITLCPAARAANVKTIKNMMRLSMK